MSKHPALPVKGLSFGRRRSFFVRVGIQMRRESGAMAQNVSAARTVYRCGPKPQRYLWNTRADGIRVRNFERYRHKGQTSRYLKKHSMPEGML